MSEKTVLNMEATNEEGVSLTIEIQGQSDIPFWKHDLKLEAIKALLNTIDMKDFYEVNKHEEFYKHLAEIQELLNAVGE